VLLAEGKMGGYGLAVGFGCHIGMINGLLRSVSSVQIIGKNLLSGLFQLGPATRFSRGWAEVIPDWRGFQLSFLSVSSVFISGEVFVFRFRRFPAISIRSRLLFNLGDLWQYPAIMTISSTPAPAPYVHPIPPKVTQCHPRLRESAEGRKPEMIRGANPNPNPPLQIVERRRPRLRGEIFVPINRFPDHARSPDFCNLSAVG
jgi:hypothetical protein